MSKPIRRMSREELRRRLAAQNTTEGTYVGDVDPRIDPNLQTTAQASVITGLSHKKLLRLAEQGKLCMLEVSERCLYFKKEEIFALAAELDRLPASPPLDGRYSRVDSSVYLSVCPETVTRMERDGRLGPRTVINGRPYWTEAQLQEAALALNYKRHMDIDDICALIGLRSYDVDELWRVKFFPPPRERGWRRSEVFARWERFQKDPTIPPYGNSDAAFFYRTPYAAQKPTAPPRQTRDCRGPPPAPAPPEGDCAGSPIRRRRESARRARAPPCMLFTVFAGGLAFDRRVAPQPSVAPLAAPTGRVRLRRRHRGAANGRHGPNARTACAPLPRGCRQPASTACGCVAVIVRGRGLTRAAIAGIG